MSEAAKITDMNRLPPRLRLTLLGHFDMQGQGCLEVSAKKNKGLLAILALSPGGQATREKICGLLWGERSDEQARQSLRQSLAILRKELGPVLADVLRARDDVVGLGLDRVDVDAVEFLSVSPTGSKHSLARAAELCAGELLADVALREPGFDDWLAEQRRRMSDHAIAVFEKLAAMPDNKARLAHAKHLIDLDPLREASHRALMLAYNHAGETGLALQQFETCKNILSAEFSVTPAAETLQLRAVIAKGESPTPVVPDTGTFKIAAANNAKPTIAVLPFTNLSSDREQTYFADGITEDIITELSRFRGLFVVARNSSFAFRGKPHGMEAIAKELGVSFVVEGSVRKSSGRVRISAQLVNAATGVEIWAERYDRDICDIFAVQDDVARTVAATLEGKIASAIAEHSKRQTPGNIAAYECLLRARKLLDGYDGETAEPFLRRALASDPNYAQAHALMAMACWIRFFFNHRPEDIAEAISFGKAAVALDPADTTGHMHLGFSYLFAREFDLADVHSQKAVDLNPSDMLALSLRAHFLCRVGRCKEALDAVDVVIKHDPLPPDWYWENRSVILLTMENYEEALSAVRRLPNLFWWSYCSIAVCHIGQGRVAPAREAIARAIELCPGLTISRCMKSEPYRHQADADRLIRGLMAAGLPE